jgi:hypothetical protein
MTATLNWNHCQILLSVSCLYFQAASALFSSTLEGSSNSHSQSNHRLLKVERTTPELTDRRTLLLHHSAGKHLAFSPQLQNLPFYMATAEHKNVDRTDRQTYAKVEEMLPNVDRLSTFLDNFIFCNAKTGLILILNFSQMALLQSLCKSGNPASRLLASLLLLRTDQ